MHVDLEVPGLCNSCSVGLGGRECLGRVGGVREGLEPVCNKLSLTYIIPEVINLKSKKVPFDTCLEMSVCLLAFLLWDLHQGSIQ